MAALLRVLVLSLILLPATIWAAAPTYDSSVSASATDGVATLTTASWTIAGSDRYLVCGIGSGDGTPVDVSSVKWGGSGGTAMTKQGSTLNIGSFLKLSLYTLVAPTAQTSTIYADWGSAQGERFIACVSANGVDQTTSIGTPATATGSAGNAVTVNVTTVADDFVVDFVWGIDNDNSNPVLTVGAGQTSRQEQEGATYGYEAGGASTEVATTTSTTMSWTMAPTTGVTENWGIIGVGLKPTAGGGGAATNYFRLRVQP